MALLFFGIGMKTDLFQSCGHCCIFHICWYIECSTLTASLNVLRWSIQKQIDYILCSQRWRSSIQSVKTRLGADCGSDHELLTAKFGLKLKKVGKTTRSFRYDKNENPYDYTVEMRDRFKGLDLIDRVPEELRMELHDII